MDSITCGLKTVFLSNGWECENTVFDPKLVESTDVQAAIQKADCWKQFTYEWTCTVQTHVVQGSTVFVVMPNIFRSLSHILFYIFYLPYFLLLCFNNPPCTTPTALVKLFVSLLHSLPLTGLEVIHFYTFGLPIFPQYFIMKTLEHTQC